VPWDRLLSAAPQSSGWAPSLVVSNVMKGQQDRAPVAGEVAPGRVEVIRPVLSTVVLDEEHGPLDPVVMRFAYRRAACPGKANFQVQEYATFTP